MKRQRQKSLQYLLLAGCIALPLVVGAMGAVVTASEIPGWYAVLHKPFFSPPNWIFGPVWTILYILQGIALYVVLRKPGQARRAVALFMAQLALNLAWSVIFFGLHQPLWALFEIVGLWLTLLATIHEFFQHSRLAGALLIPYIAWVSFAIALTMGVVYLN